MKIILIVGACQQVVPTRMSKKKNREKINEDRRYTIDEISEATGVSCSSCRRILTVDLDMRRGAPAKFVRRLLTQEQKIRSFVFVGGIEKSD